MNWAMSNLTMQAELFLQAFLLFVFFFLLTLLIFFQENHQNVKTLWTQIRLHVLSA